MAFKRISKWQQSVFNSQHTINIWPGIIFKKNPQSKILPRTKIDFQGLVGNALLPTFPSVLYRIHGCFPPNISLSLFLLLSPLLLWKQPQPLDARREWSQELPAVLQTEPASSVRWLLCGWFGTEEEEEEEGESEASPPSLFLHFRGLSRNYSRPFLSDIHG